MCCHNSVTDIIIKLINCYTKHAGKIVLSSNGSTIIYDRFYELEFAFVGCLSVDLLSRQIYDCFFAFSLHPPLCRVTYSYRCWWTPITIWWSWSYNRSRTTCPRAIQSTSTWHSSASPTSAVEKWQRRSATRSPNCSFLGAFCNFIFMTKCNCWK